MTTIIYNGIDITQDIELMSCIYSDTNGGKQDSCKLSFSNSINQWNDWKPAFDDVVVVKKEYCNSGEMYINDIAENNGVYSILLLSTPTTTKQKKNKVWRDVRLSEIISDVSSEIGFKSQFYGFTDVYYKALTQCNETSLAFISKICKYEGLNIKIYDKQIIVFNEKELIQATPQATINITDVTQKNFDTDGETISSVTIQNFDIITNKLIKYTAKSGLAGSNIKINMLIDNVGQAERWASNLLLNINSKRKTATLNIKYADVLASGSIVELQGFNDNDGIYYIYNNVVDMANDSCILDLYKAR